MTTRRERKKQQDEKIVQALEEAADKKAARLEKEAAKAAKGGKGGTAAPGEKGAGSAPEASAPEAPEAAADTTDTADAAAPERLGAAETAKRVSENVLGDMLGVGGKGSEEAPAELPEDTVVLSVEEDRTRLALTGTGFLLLAFLGLFLVAGGLGATQLTNNIGYLVLLVVGLPIAWFSSKTMGKRFGRLISHANVVDFCERHVFIYEKSDAKKARVLTYKEIKNYQLIRQGKSLRLLLAGDWVTHPSGFYLVSIDRPFMSGGLDELEGSIRAVMREHRVNERK